MCAQGTTVSVHDYYIVSMTCLLLVTIDSGQHIEKTMCVCLCVCVCVLVCVCVCVCSHKVLREPVLSMREPVFPLKPGLPITDIYHIYQ